MGETARLTHGQREGHFHRGLALERVLAELPALREQFLAALARTEESLHAQHTRHMAAATTGEDPEARPHQQGLFKDSPISAPSQASKRPKPAPRKEEQPDPEPPKGAARPRPRASTEAKGTRRAEKTASARTVAEATPLSVDDDALPAPAVPCCTCGDSLADHQDGHGACRATKCPAKPRCEAFQLGRVWDWEVRWRSGLDAAGRLTFFLYRENEERSAFSNWGPFVMQDGALTSVETGWRVLEQARKLGGRWPGGGKGDVPVRVLEFVERFLAEASPEVPTAPVSTREQYMAETREAYPDFTEDDVLVHVENRLLHDGHPLPAAPEFSELDATALLDAHLGAREEGKEYKDELEVTGTDVACEHCGTRTSPRARLAFGRSQRPQGAKTWRADRDSRCSAHWFGLRLCSRCCTPEALAEKRRARLGPAEGVEENTPEVLNQEGSAAASVSPAPKPDNGERWWALSDGLDLEVTHAGTGNARLWVSAHGRRDKACYGPFTLDAAGGLTPVAGANSVSGRWQASPEGQLACRSVEHFIEESEFARAAVAYLRPSSADTESTCDGCGHTFKASQLQPVGPEGARGFYCASCRAEQEAQDEKPEPPAAPAARPHAGAPVESSVQLELGGSDEPKTGDPLGSATTEEVGDLKQVRRVLKGTKAGSPLWARLRRVVAVLVTSAREESWSYLAGDEQWRIRLDTHTERGEVWLSHGARALGTAGPWLWDGQTLTRAEDWAAPHTWPLKGTSAVAELTKLELSMEAALAAQAESPAPPPQENTGGTWRVELPERLRGRSLLVPLWLVNEALGERRAASWWGRGSGGLKPSHHVAGTLRGAALEEHVALQSWWKEHAETVVKPLEQACCDGAVPGLRVGVPEEPLADGPFFYALSGGWRLEAWEPDEGEPHVYFSQLGTVRHGPFAWEAGWLVASEVAAIAWAQEAAHVVREAEDFIHRGFVYELRAGQES